MDKVITGMCPTQGKEYSITVHYRDVSDMTSECYVKTTSCCEYNKFGNKCDSSKCPLIKSAPNNLP